MLLRARLPLSVRPVAASAGAGSTSTKAAAARRRPAQAPPAVVLSHRSRAFSSNPMPERRAEPFKILFCGSDAFSTAALRAVLEAEDVWQSITVMTPRDQAVSRRGKKTYVAPLKTFALDACLPTHDIPASGLDGDFTFPRPFTEHHPAHLLLTASFGHIIPTPLLSPFAHSLNVHPSMLPKYRGAAPVQWAIANRDPSTGVSVQTVGAREAGVDSGAILGAVGDVPIPTDATYNTLLPELSHLGGRVLVAVLRQLMRGEAVPHVQSGEPTRAPKLTTARARVDWTQPAAALEARHRAFSHHTPLWAEYAGQPVQLLGVRLPGAAPPHTHEHTHTPGPEEETAHIASLVDRVGAQLGPGTAVLDRRRARVLVHTGDGWVAVVHVKSAGRKDAPAAEWWNGLPKPERERGWIVFE